MSMTSESIDEFLERLASAAPTPGGGSAAAISGAMGAALISMVCNVTFGKKGYEAVEADMRAIRADADSLRLRLAAMVDDDIAAFDGLMAAYKLPKATDGDKAGRAAAIQRSLTRATEVPLECARACTAVIGLARRVAEQGYKGVISDAGVGVLTAHAALRSAALNIYINAPALHDREAAQRYMTEMDALVSTGGAENEAVYAIVRSRL